MSRIEAADVHASPGDGTDGMAFRSALKRPTSDIDLYSNGN
jgi:hypothetical protein